MRDGREEPPVQATDASASSDETNAAIIDVLVTVKDEIKAMREDVVGTIKTFGQEAKVCNYKPLSSQYRMLTYCFSLQVLMLLIPLTNPPNSLKMNSSKPPPPETPLPMSQTVSSREAQ
ncbi:hypothetical protein KEM55_004352 [Ascosphaera atra]|nr:hypothetical protein KEM55_004352 [Ascosphaera atra]